MKKEALKICDRVIDFTAGTVVMGVLNVTADSFSDGGSWIDSDAAVGHAIEMIRAGAAIIDVGGESTRPGAKRVSPEEQIERAVPIIRKLAEASDVAISIDSRDWQVAKAALEAGACIINDISACGDDKMAELAADSGSGLVLMHMQGEPASMQEKPSYNDVVSEVLDYLLGRAEYCQKLGVDKGNIIIDPGIGFGKSFEHNIELLKNLDKFTATDYRVLLGASRKAFLGKITGHAKAADRDYGTAATSVLAVQAGVDIVRVHNVAMNIEQIKVANSILLGGIS